MNIHNVNSYDYKLLWNVSKNKGVSVNQLIKGYLREIKEELANIPDTSKGRSIRVRGLSKDTETEIKQISKLLNVPYSNLVKVIIHLKVKKLDNFYKREPELD